MNFVYVAAASTEIDRAESVIARLRAGGITITHDWTTLVRACGANTGDDAILLPALRDDMLIGVRNADIVLVLAGNSSTGKHVELGGAFLCRGVSVHISGDCSKEPWLRALGEKFYASDDEAIAALTGAP